MRASIEPIIHRVPVKCVTELGVIFVQLGHNIDVLCADDIWRAHVCVCVCVCVCVRVCVWVFSDAPGGGVSARDF